MDESDAAMVGKRAEKRSSPVASSQRWSTPCSAMRAAMARLTTSRGASSSTKRSPSRSRSSAPSPRSASDSSGRGMAGWCSAVGWNCTNSTSAAGRRPAAPWPGRRPSTGAGWWSPRRAGRRRRWPARRGRPAARRPVGAAGGRAITPRQRPPSTMRSRANQPSRTALAGGRRVDEGALHLGAGGGAAGVHDPGREWPPSRARARGPSPRGRTRRRGRSARAPGPGPR